MSRIILSAAVVAVIVSVITANHQAEATFAQDIAHLFGGGGGVCGHSCAHNNDCSFKDATRCTRCEEVMKHGHRSKMCVPGTLCYSNCTVDTDCKQCSECNTCVDKRCMVGCGRKCDSSLACPESCAECRKVLPNDAFRTCQVPLPVADPNACGGYCRKDGDCDSTPGTLPTGGCKKCREFWGTGSNACLPGLACQQRCNSSSDCYACAICNHCVNGFCTKKCDMPCNGNLECPTSCPFCTTKPGHTKRTCSKTLFPDKVRCGDSCQNHNECQGQGHTCTNCAGPEGDKKCMPGAKCLASCNRTRNDAECAAPCDCCVADSLSTTSPQHFRCYPACDKAECTSNNECQPTCPHCWIYPGDTKMKCHGTAPPVPEPNACGGICYKNGDCNPNTVCKRCDKSARSTAPGDFKLCLPGITCQKKCSSNRDCYGCALCTQCIDGACSTRCNQQCVADLQCPESCPYCVSGANGETVRRCRSQVPTPMPTAAPPAGHCGGHCAPGNNNECNQNSTCHRCENSICVPGKKCLASCNVSTDCDQTEGSLCKWCFEGKCRIGCGQKCGGRTQGQFCETGCSDCKFRSSLGYHTCEPKIPVPDPNQCGGVCYNNADCNSAKYCNVPSANSCRPFGDGLACLPGVTCRKVCKSNADCYGCAICSTCIDGNCATKCNAKCDTSLQCPTSCPHCNMAPGRSHKTCEKEIHPPQCGHKCENHNECLKAESDCTMCAMNAAGTHKVCRRGGSCGAVCNRTDAECDQTGECNACPAHVNRCVANCGAPCSSDAVCGDPTCSHCVVGPGATVKTCLPMTAAPATPVPIPNPNTCGGPCRSKSDCSTAPYCKQNCRPGPGNSSSGSMCLPGLVCQKKCSSDRDCYACAVCTTCNDGVCSARCGAVCQSSLSCPTSCPFCAHGPGETQRRCRKEMPKPGQCFGSCAHNNDCTQNTSNVYCTRCAATLDGTLVCQPGFMKCGSECEVTSDCDQSGNSPCNTCYGGKCYAPCGGMKCTSDAQCHPTMCKYCRKVDGHAYATCQYHPAPTPMPSQYRGE